MRAIARDKSTPWPKRAAAERVVRTMEYGDLADMESILDGSVSLKQLRAYGINTEVIKKIKVKKTVEYDDEGDPVSEQTEREVELHDRAGDDFDRVMDRTEGRPRQEVTAHVDNSLRSEAEGEAAAAGLLAALKERSGSDKR